MHFLNDRTSCMIDPGSKSWPTQVRGIMLFMSAFFAVMTTVVAAAAVLGKTQLASLGWFVVQAALSLLFLFGFLRFVQWAYRVGLTRRLRKQGVLVPPRPPRVGPKWSAILGVAVLILFGPSGAIYVFNTVRDSGITWELAIGTLFYVAFTTTGWILFDRGRKGMRDGSEAYSPPETSDPGETTPKRSSR